MGLTSLTCFTNGDFIYSFSGFSNPVTLNLFSTSQLYRQTTFTHMLTSPSLPNTNLGGLNLWCLGSPFSSRYDLFLRGYSYHVTPFHSHILREWWMAGSSCCGYMRGFPRLLLDDYLATNMIMTLNQHPMKKANTCIYSVHSTCWINEAWSVRNDSTAQSYCLHIACNCNYRDQKWVWTWSWVSANLT